MKETKYNYIKQHNIADIEAIRWSEVKPRIEAALRPLIDVRVIIYEPKGTPITEINEIIDSKKPLE